MAVIVPGDAIELRQALELALRRDGPTFIRLCRNPTPVLVAGAEPLQLGKIRKLRDGRHPTIAVCGVPTTFPVLRADSARASASIGLMVDTSSRSTDTPRAASLEAASMAMNVEEHTICSGLGSAVAEALALHAPALTRMIGIQDTFAESGDWADLMRKYGIAAEHIEAEAVAFAAESA